MYILNEVFFTGSVLCSLGTLGAYLRFTNTKVIMPKQVGNLFLKVLLEDQIKIDPTTIEAFSSDWCPKFKNNPLAVLYPKTNEEVVEIVRLANQEKIILVPSAGRTGLSGGATPLKGSIVVSLEKMNKITNINIEQRTLSTQAGVVTAKIHQAAEDLGLYFPIHFTTQESSLIGGNAGTNVGGIHVVRYGSFRDWVLGIKVVTGKGDLLNINSDLYKNQTGYDLKNLFIGSEGTLGIITELTLKLTNKPNSHTRVIVGIAEPTTALKLLKEIRSKNITLSAIEYFDRLGLEKVLQHHKLKEPLQEIYKHYVLIEVEDNEFQENQILENIFSGFIEEGIILDATISQSTKQAAEFLSLRERIGEVLAKEYKAHKNDLAVSVSKMPIFIEKLSELLKLEYKDYQFSLFGHIGDGNLHLNILKPKDEDFEKFKIKCAEADKKVFKLISELGGSISAEHGVGLLKKDFLHFSRTENEIYYMKEIKKVFDPNQILNPGKIFS